MAKKKKTSVFEKEIKSPGRPPKKKRKGSVLSRNGSIHKKGYSSPGNF